MIQRKNLPSDRITQVTSNSEGHDRIRYVHGIWRGTLYGLGLGHIFRGMPHWHISGKHLLCAEA